jgi:hypothetical protein
MARKIPVHEVLGKAPQDRLAWALERFVNRDPSSLENSDRRGVEEGLRRYVAEHDPNGAVAAYISSDDLREAREELCRLFRTIALGEEYQFAANIRIGAAVEYDLELSPTRLIWGEFGSLTTTLVKATLALIVEIPITMLRRCRYHPVPAAEECGRVFIGRKTQNSCVMHREVVRKAQLRTAFERFRQRQRVQATSKGQRRRGSVMS